MTEVTRAPNNRYEIGGAIVIIMSYLAFYRSVVEPLVPGESSTELLVSILGLILLGIAFSLIYLSNIYAVSTQGTQ